MQSPAAGLIISGCRGQRQQRELLYKRAHYPQTQGWEARGQRAGCRWLSVLLNSRDFLSASESRLCKACSEQQQCYCCKASFLPGAPNLPCGSQQTQNITGSKMDL